MTRHTDYGLGALAAEGRWPPQRDLISPEIVVDNFAGGGGASTGIEAAIGRPIDVAINHDPEAIAMHKANHPQTKHYCEDVYDVDPLEATGGQPVGLAWFSPDCKHFSKAKGGKPVDKNIRGLAWVVVTWAQRVRPRVIILENVEEFRDWGPLTPDNKPDPERRGFTFERWKAELEKCGYVVELRELRACDYGAPTIRKRLFVIARCDGQPIEWPDATHGDEGEPYRTAAECIDWDIPCPSIFERKRPLAEATMRRIANGIRRYVFEAKQPFVVAVSDTPQIPTLIQTGYGERPGQAPRVPGLMKPLGTVVGCGVKHALVTAFLAKHFGGNESPGWPLDKSMSTVTAKDHHALVVSHMVKFKGTSKDGQPIDEPLHTAQASGLHHGLVTSELSQRIEKKHREVRAFLINYYSQGSGKTGRAVDQPAPTLRTRDCVGLVEVEGIDYQIVDIGMRMLQPRELFNAQGFDRDYVIDPQYNGKPLTKTAQVRMAGNSVCPPISEVLVNANFRHEQEARVAN